MLVGPIGAPPRPKRTANSANLGPTEFPLAPNEASRRAEEDGISRFSEMTELGELRHGKARPDV